MAVTPAVERVAKVAHNEHPRVRQFHMQAAAILEKTPDGPAAVRKIADLFGAVMASDWNRETALLEDLRRAVAEGGISRAMFASVVRSAAREVERSARLAGRVQHLRDVEEHLLGLAQRIDGAHPEISEAIQSALVTSEDQTPPETGFVTLGLQVDHRHAMGEFAIDGRPAEDSVRYPFVGWTAVVELADPDAHRSFEAAYEVNGRIWPVSQLYKAGYHLKRNL